MKASQVWHRLVRPIRQKLSNRHQTRENEIAYALQHTPVVLASMGVQKRLDPDSRTFTFLNQSKQFGETIDWNYHDLGLLWHYNLHYFEWLYDETISAEHRLDTIRSYVRTNKSLHSQDGYPLSLRIVAWCHFLLQYKQRDTEILKYLFADAEWLSRYPEYHLRGNHLFENALALFYSGMFFKNKIFALKGERLLRSCIREQILDDGGHIEGSPMYHSLLLWRMLQCLELYQLEGEKNETYSLIDQTTAKMLGWICAITYKNGEWPMVNDCAPDIAPTTAALISYAHKLGVQQVTSSLNQSGYRMIRVGAIELFLDLSSIQPDEQPGHTHADISSFCLNYQNTPYIVDVGTSLYNNGDRRLVERGTQNHNTVCICGKNSSEIWKGFRVGRRAKLIKVVENESSISIWYRPYFSSSIIHKRTFTWATDRVQIKDDLTGLDNGESTAAIHLHPAIRVEQQIDSTIQAGELRISISPRQKVAVEPYLFAQSFHILQPANSLKYIVSQELVTTTIEIVGKGQQQ